jgi:hypothetical protein
MHCTQPNSFAQSEDQRTKYLKLVKSPMIKCSTIPNLNRTLLYLSLLCNFPITTSAVYLKHLREHVILLAGNLTEKILCVQRYVEYGVFNDMSNMACSTTCRIWRVQRHIEYGVFNNMSNMACSTIFRIWRVQRHVEYGVLNDISNMACSTIFWIWQCRLPSLQMKFGNSLTKA